MHWISKELYEQLSIFFLFFFGHILDLIKICQYGVYVLNFLVTFLLLTTNTALYSISTFQLRRPRSSMQRKSAL